MLLVDMIMSNINHFLFIFIKRYICIRPIQESVMERSQKCIMGAFFILHSIPNFYVVFGENYLALNELSRSDGHMRDAR